MTLVDKLVKSGIVSVVITGGEPFLHPRINDICNLAIERFISITILSNGMFLHKSKEWLMSIKSKRRVGFSISLDGANEFANCITRKDSDTELIWNNARMLRDIGFTVDIACTVTRKLTKEAIYELADRAEYEELKFLKFLPLLPVGMAKQNWSVLSPSIDMIKFIHLYCRNNTRNISVSTGFSDFLFSDSSSCVEDGSRKLMGCSAGHDGIAINCVGDVYPCNAWPKPMGNIFECDLEDILSNSPIAQEIRNARNSSVVEIDECFGCEYSSVCYGGCRAVAYSMHGDIMAIDPYCWHRGGL